MAYNPGTPEGRVRLLINDIYDDGDDRQIFTDAEISNFLLMEGSVVKLAAAQALDTIADNEALASKVIRTQDVTTDGAKLADSLHKRADSLRVQASKEDPDEDWAFEVAAFQPGYFRPPELTEWPTW